MNVLEEILEEIEERVNMVENIPVDEDDGFLDGEECYEAGRIQGRYEELVWCRNIIRSHMDEVQIAEIVAEENGIRKDMKTVRKIMGGFLTQNKICLRKKVYIL